MFERFTDRARRALVLAEKDARELGHMAIMPGHLLLGLREEAEGVAGKAMAAVGADLVTLRSLVAGAFDSSEERKKVNRVPFSPKAKKVLEFSLREALQLGHNYIGTEHLLLGVLRQVSADDPNTDDLFGLPVRQLRQAVITTMAGAVPAERMSPALRQAINRARTHAGQDPMTTGHQLLAISEDPTSQATKALSALGVAREALMLAIAQVPLAETSDAAPESVVVELKVGNLSVRITDPDLAGAVSSATAEQLLTALRSLGASPVDEPDQPSE